MVYRSVLAGTSLDSRYGEWAGSCTRDRTGCVSLTTEGSDGTGHTCSGRHSQYSCELLAPGSRSCIAQLIRPA